METLNKYFKKVNEAPPVISKEELLKKVQEADIPQNLFSLQKILLKIGIAAVALTSLLTTFFFLKSSSHQEKIAQQNTFKKVDEAPFKNELDDLYPNTQLQGISFLELTEEELAKMGITVSEAGITYYSNMRAQSAFEKAPLKEWPEEIIASKHIIKYEKWEYPPNETVPFDFIKFSPRIISDGAGKTRMWWFDESIVAPELDSNVDFKKYKEGEISYDEFRKEMSKVEKLAQKKYSNPNVLIPILVRAKEQFPKNPTQPFSWKENFIFWYDATPEFIAALPERFKSTLVLEGRAMQSLAMQAEKAENDLAAIPSPQQVLKEIQRKELKVESQEILIPEREKHLTGETYFDVWRGASGALVSSQIFPNPVTGKRATVKFSLKEDRNVIITLHDIFGRRIAELTRGAFLKSGEHSLEVLLKGTERGIYLIAIHTDKGEQAVQRLLVE
ncbi:MAG TPA: T9SS type A sorting domain-containing protein [Patescibacteria group bacterium]|nr:T9SS type A sorting domain-containing protein [Patescibacteria group bacterium]